MHYQPPADVVAQVARFGEFKVLLNELAFPSQMQTAFPGVTFIDVPAEANPGRDMKSLAE